METKIGLQANALTVSLVETSESFQCRDGETLLQGLARLGRKGIPVGCLNGGCGICKVHILSGDVECGAMSRAHVGEDEVCRGVVLACRARPRTDVQLKVVGKMCNSVFRCTGKQHP
ncbi:ferredoxin [Massilia sp. WF1]|uniref:2Fe-2S iron-sulfur cluster-binding protein n=1 Tax=unclassified Massilia TaxID=2609279 RepID=UPI00068D10F3|nr:MULTISPECIES: 2Fe-2S iron-sulfur cluster-binding protein [unclassified Massilia]ALK97920.1 ferredoxin [Massilia sp. WG5]KNZ67658.1 ferredoxin [Massilia sp. WF1]